MKIQWQVILDHLFHLFWDMHTRFRFNHFTTPSYLLVNSLTTSLYTPHGMLQKNEMPRQLSSFRNLTSAAFISTGRSCWGMSRPMLN